MNHDLEQPEALDAADDEKMKENIALGLYDNLEHVSHLQLKALYETFSDVYAVPVLDEKTKNAVFIHNIHECLRLHALGELKKKFTFTDDPDFQPLDIVDDRTLEQRLFAGDATMAMLRKEHVLVYRELPHDQIVYVRYGIKPRRGDKHAVITLYENLCARMGYQPKIIEVSLETFTKLAENYE